MAGDTTDPSVKALVQSLKGDTWVNNLFIPRSLFCDGKVSDFEYSLFGSAEYFTPAESFKDYYFDYDPELTHKRGTTVYYVYCTRFIQFIDGYVNIRNIRITRKAFMYHLLEQKVIDRESVLFCNKDGSKICSDLTRDQYEQIIKTMCFFAKPCTWFTPLNRPDANLIADSRLIGVTNDNEVLIYDFFKRYPLDEYQDIIDAKALKAFVVYNDYGHLCRARMNEESSQTIQKYIEDHEF